MIFFSACVCVYICVCVCVFVNKRIYSADIGSIYIFIGQCLICSWRITFLLNAGKEGTTGFLALGKNKDKKI